METTYPFNPDWAVPVGEILWEEFLERDLTISDVAREIGIPSEQLCQALYGHAKFTREMAEVISTIVDMPPEFLLRVQENYLRRISIMQSGNASETEAAAAAHASAAPENYPTAEHQGVKPAQGEPDPEPEETQAE